MAVSTVKNPTVAFTTPRNYASRLSHLLTLNDFKPVWCPTLIIQPTPSTLSPYLSPHSLDPFSAIAFTSRTAIQAFNQATIPLSHPPLSPSHTTFTLAALGNDSQLLDRQFLSKLCTTPDKVRVLVPPIATPTSLVEALGAGNGRKVLCPVPLVVDLQEPPVVPGFLQELRYGGWLPVRVEAYETRWAGPWCAQEIVRATEEVELDALIFTSSAEVEGLLKSLTQFGLCFNHLKRNCPKLVVAAHGPVTAAGAHRLGVEVDLVSSKFDSFHGVVDVLKCYFS